MSRFEVRHVIKSAEADNWADGCIGSCHEYAFDMHFEAATLDELITQMNYEFDCDYVQIAACDDSNRIEFSRIEDDGGDKVGEQDFLREQWKAGECNLWLARYCVYVDVVERSPAVFEEKEYEL